MLHSYQTNLNSLVKEPELHQEPKQLPKGYEWYQPQLPEDLDLIYNLLHSHYVESDGLKLSYPKEFLNWALSSPTQPPEWLVAVKAKDKLVAFIAGLPITIEGKTSVFINFLCVHKQLRGKRLAPLMIAEVSRRVSISDVWTAYYTSADNIAQPMATIKYYSRCLNLKAFAKLGITLPKPKAISALIPEYQLELMKASELETIHQLYQEQCKKFQLYSSYTLQEFQHWFQNKDNLVYTYVLKDNFKVIDFISFYELPSLHPLGQIKVAYLFFYSCKATFITSLLKSLITLTTNLGFDAFNCTNIMHNAEFLERLGFIADTQPFYYYNFNSERGTIKPRNIGLPVL